ncbi:Methyl-accepting chemotaxis protein [Alkalibacterium sp. AK22]|uniref:methyl-accepting chemotaxis protein n=1 Tax=Alkalibacterium sp. AK22 TaxID=1229520 RepID=UPI00044E7393|nr:methyl-accepting chemotaxis protein [Alkalibacterium sp. AK22]EXJ22404.1 Methyl-accepting chemotaxis protein [Alkalibacterium sp. AK22]
MNKNKLMVTLAGMITALTVLVHILHRLSILSSHTHGGHHHPTAGLPDTFYPISFAFLSLPLLLQLLSVALLFKNPKHRLLPLLVTLILTFAVISMIMGGHGSVEYHFGIFTVLAAMTYYQSTNLVMLMTGLFTFQHLFGYFFAPATVFVYGIGEYSFLMVLIHAIFLLLTAGTVIWQITSSKKQVAVLEKINASSEQTLFSIIDQLKSTSAHVEDTSHRLTDNALNTRSSSEKVKEALKDILEITDQQVGQTENSQSVLVSLLSSIESIEQNAESIVSSSSILTSESAEGSELVRQTTSEITQLAEAFEQVDRIIMSLDEKAKEISGIITVISDISDKTNLLALNAAIEAAQAGETGKGFAVVAEEVRKLSDQTDEAVARVSSVIKAVQKDSAEASLSVTDGGQKMKESLISVSKTEAKFHHIHGAAIGLDKDIQLTAKTAKQISVKSKDIQHAVKRIQQSASKTTAVVEHADQLSVDQMKRISETTTIAANLQREVEKLDPLIRELQLQQKDSAEETDFNAPLATTVTAPA